MGNTSFGRIRRIVQVPVRGENQAKATRVWKLLRAIRTSHVCVREMSLPGATVENREIQDAARVEPTPLSVYNQEVHPDWALEFNLTGGGS